MKKKISNYENYEIYDTGEVFNTITGKKLKGSIRLHGYLQYRLSKNNEKTGFYAHRLVAEAFLENPNQYTVVNHKDGNKLNNNVNNLEWVSQSDNMKHAYENNLIKSRREAEYYINDLENEIWMDIPDFPNYLLSSYARVMNKTTKRILKPSITTGYYKIRLSREGYIKDYLLHHLVFKTFNSNFNIPEGYKIDHIDGNKLNNHINNLRCVSNSENALNALYVTNTNNSNKPVALYDRLGNLLNTFRSVREAAKLLNLDSSTISKVCRGLNKSHGGFIFKYVN